MTVEELKEALFEKCPVEYKGMKFARITRISFELNGERFINTATLADKNGHSEVTVLGKDVQRCTN